MGAVKESRPARIDELTDAQLQLLFQAYQTRESGDDGKEQLNPDPNAPGGGSVPTHVPKHKR